MSTSVSILTALVILSTACGVSSKNIHKWGSQGKYERIRAEISKQPSEEVRIAIAAELGKGDYSFAIPDLILLSKDSSYKVRAAAVNALGQYAGAEVYNAIIQRTGDDNIEVARSAEQILRTWGEESVQFLLEAADDRNYKVRVAAITILGRMKDAAISPVLMAKAQRDDNNIVRREAVRAIGNRGLKEAKKILYKIKKTDSSREVMLAAEEALSKIGGNILNSTAVLFPFQVENDRQTNVKTALNNAVASQIVSNHLCNLLQAGDLPEADWRNAMLAEAQKLGADEAISGQIQVLDGQLTINLIRLNAKNGLTIQQESYSGLESTSNKVIDELVKRLISHFI